MPRGRPRKYDEDQVLTSAMLLFWKKGLSATSLDDLADAMQMNRPSIYNAFGNKEDIYRRSLARVAAQLDAAMERLVQAQPDLKTGITEFFFQAIDVYQSDGLPLGCLMMCTAPSEAFSHPAIAEDLDALIQRVDDGFKVRIDRAQKEGALPSTLKASMAAKMLQATLQSIALRARAGESKQSLRRFSRYAVDTIFEVGDP